ncbi:type VI secretion system protein ImpA [Chitinispirillum alkaliphilum]|nr:type VI secretion system protein ImpA [Chitinispirillum alkaliphilum]
MVKAEIGKLANIDFDTLEQKSFSLLTEKSKDIRLFSFLGFCYLKKGEWQCFCDVFDSLGQLMGKDYGSLFPIRPRAKQLSLKWLSENRFVDTIENAKPDTEAHEHVKRLSAALLKMKDVLNAEFPNGAPFPAKLYSAAQKWEKQTEPKKEEPPKPQTSQAQTGGSASGAAASGTQASSSAASASAASTGPLDSPKDALESIRKSALFLIGKQPESPRGYRFLRAVRWGSVENAPVSDGTTTRLEPPPPERRNSISALLEKGDYKSALDTAEKVFSSGPTHYWLDLQRISATAASQLGPAYASVRDAIVLETALFLKRLPEVKNLCYSDGTPFCDPATVDWIEDEVASLFSSESASNAGKVNDSVEEDRKEVNGLVSQKKVDSALDLLLGKISDSNSERDNFRRRVIVASVMYNAKRTDLALYILETLAETIDKFNLCAWEPELCSETLSLLARVYASAAQGKQGPSQLCLLEKRENVMKKLSFVNPKAAYKQKQ